MRRLRRRHVCQRWSVELHRLPCWNIFWGSGRVGYFCSTRSMMTSFVLAATKLTPPPFLPFKIVHRVRERKVRQRAEHWVRRLPKGKVRLFQWQGRGIAMLRLPGRAVRLDEGSYGLAAVYSLRQGQILRGRRRFRWYFLLPLALRFFFPTYQLTRLVHS